MSADWQRQLLETLTRLDATMVEVRSELRELRVDVQGVRTEVRVLAGHVDGFLEHERSEIAARVKELEDWRRRYDPSDPGRKHPG